METIDITPDKSLLPKLGFAGYTAPQAIGELVDNSLDAMIDGEPLTVSIKISSKEISVADTGTGMVKEVFAKSMVPAFSRKKGKLGEFGLGLKTASLSLGGEFEVISKARDEHVQYRIRFDEREWMDKEDGWKLPVETAKMPNDDHYTVVIIRKLKIFYPALANYIREDLQKRYSPFIRAGLATIKANDIFCQPEEVNLIPGSQKQFKILTKSGNEIRGWYGLLQEGSNKGLYGFHTYRRNRMITTYDKIAIGEHPTISRIIGDIHLDHVSVTHNKREFIKESAAYREAEELLREEFRELIRAARKKASEETVTKEVKSQLDIWKDKIAQAINSSDFKNYTSRFKNLSQLVADKTGEEKATVDIEKRGKREKATPMTLPQSSNDRNRTPKQTHKAERHVIRIRGKNVEFSHQFAPLGVKESWKKYSYSPGHVIEIFTNTDFPAYMVTRDKVFYAVIHIAEALAEVMVYEAQEDSVNVNEIKETILRKSSELREQFSEAT
jgi:hypothetical protein